MARKATLLIAVALLACGLGRPVAAQMFGPRALGGQSIGPQPRPGQAPAAQPRPPSNDPNANLLSGFETGIDIGLSRFLRENRGEGAFVGRGSDAPGFVGSVQTDNQGAIRSAVDTLMEAPLPNVNRAAVNVPVMRPGPYRPRLTLGFAAPQPSSQAIERDVTADIQEALARRSLGQVEVALSGRTAILMGEVASEHDRALAAELARLSPGVSQVVNQIQTASPSEPAAPVEPAP